MADALGPYLIVVLITLPLLLLILLTLKSFRSGSRLTTVVLGMTTVHEFFLVAFPCWHSACTGFQLEKEMYATPSQLLAVVLSEACFVTLFSLVFLFSMRKRRHDQGPRKTSWNDTVIISILVIGALISNVVQIFSPGYTTIDMANCAYIVVKTKFSDILFDWINSFIRWPGMIAASIVFFSPRYPKWLRLVGALVVLLCFFLAVLNGFRGGILLVIELVIASAFLHGSKYWMTMGLLCAVLVLPFMPWIHDVLRYKSAEAAASGVARWQQLVAPASTFGDWYSKRKGRSSNSSFVESWADRAQGPRNSIGLHTLYDRNEGAGYLPIMNAFLMPIPRVFWPDKPVGGSTDSTNFGAAIYRVQQLKPDTGPTDMGPLLASSHAYWEGGTAFVLVAGLLTGLFWISLLRWTEVNPAMYKHIVVLCFMAALPIDGFFTALNPLYTFILIFYRIIPLFVLVGLGKLIRICCRRSFPSNGNQLCPSA